MQPLSVLVGAGALIGATGMSFPPFWTPGVQDLGSGEALFLSCM